MFNHSISYQCQGKVVFSTFRTLYVNSYFKHYVISLESYYSYEANRLCQPEITDLYS